MSDYTQEDREVAQTILDFQRLLLADMQVAFPEGIRAYHLSALTGTFLEMFLNMMPQERREGMWDVVKMGIDQRFEDGRL